MFFFYQTILSTSIHYFNPAFLKITKLLIEEKYIVTDHSGIGAIWAYRKFHVKRENMLELPQKHAYV